MQMTLRWFGKAMDTVRLEHIRQIPGVVGVVPALHDLPAGEAWPLARILAMKEEIEAAGLTMECIESVNVSEEIKLGGAQAARHTENYKTSVRNLAKAGVRVICYNFMPVFDWTRTDLAMPLPDGSTCLSYDGRRVEGKLPEDMFREIDRNSNGYAMPGWEPHRIGEIKALFARYRGVTGDDLWESLARFLREIIPVCAECGVRMAIHPDDPPWDIFGLPRIVKNMEDIKRLLALVDHPCNGLTFCVGSLGADEQNDLPAMIRQVGERIHFAHLRNVRRHARGFNESAHPSSEGSLDMYKIVKALHESGFDGYVRPDHGRMLWGEVARPGYGLYDRAMGAAYLNGLFEAVQKEDIWKEEVAR
ncbi:MAG: mannonate dehydratase [Oscillospiraceae bacterium]|jgi:mannonate dehydratase|nr:mannonate dehydratase [Oscillospiraceae bacterium]